MRTNGCGFRRPNAERCFCMSVPSLIRALSWLLTAIIVISFVSFVWDELGTASENQLAISRPDGQAEAITRDQHGRMLGLKHSKTRLKVDEVADAITSPGETIGDSAGNGNEWAMRVGAFVFGIAIFFFGLQALANWLALSGRPPEPEQRQDDDFTPGYR